uniref:CSON006890 protein n=1 Tax=Culicoides sonorensis TaxID=179676 RepID=A0A336KGW1_CULSO
MENSRVKPPPGVEEALSSMLWNPYPEQSSESSSDESDLDTFKRKKRPITWTEDRKCFKLAPPYTLSSRDHRFPVSNNNINHQIHQTQCDSGFRLNNKNNISNSTNKAIPSNNNFHFNSFINNNKLPIRNSKQNTNKENEFVCGSTSSCGIDSYENIINEPVFGTGETKNKTNSLKLQQNEFSFVQVVDESRSNAGAQSDHFSVIHEQKELNKFLVESTLSGCTGMRLNVPSVNMTSTTLNNNNNNTVYVSSSTTSSSNIQNESNSGQGSLTIPVNQQSSSINIVNYYRTPSKQLSNQENTNNVHSTKLKEKKYEYNKINDSKNDNNKIINENICDNVKKSHSNNNNNKIENHDVQLTSHNNVSTIQNINQVTNNENDVQNITKVSVKSSDTTRLEQCIYICSEPSNNENAITSPQNNPITQDLTSSSSVLPVSREQRRRERRERRAARNRLVHFHNINSQIASNSVIQNHISAQMHSPSHQTTIISNPVRVGNLEILPDLLPHSHLPPPYTTLPLHSGTTIIATPISLQIPVNANYEMMLRHRKETIITILFITMIRDHAYLYHAIKLYMKCIYASPSERSGKGCCGRWFAFAGPPLRALIAVVALGGVVCALGGAALGATSLAGPPQSHFTAALLMIGVGVILVTISGAAWKMTAPGGPPCLGLGTSADMGRFNRRICSRNNGHVIYPEYQHRAPPPSYQASMQEYRLRLLLLDRDRQSSVLRATSPPPTYRSSSGRLIRMNLRNNRPASQQLPSLNPSSFSIFSGISEIISGLNNVNNSESISNNSSEATLPPSYRKGNKNTRTTNNLSSLSLYDNNNTSDFTLEDVRSSSLVNLSTSICRETNSHSSVFENGQLLSNTSEQQQQPNIIINNKTSSSNNNNSCSKQNQKDSESICEIGTSNTDKNNDLVTMVTISEIIDLNEIINQSEINDTSLQKDDSQYL